MHGNAIDACSDGFFRGRLTSPASSVFGLQPQEVSWIRQEAETECSISFLLSVRVCLARPGQPLCRLRQELDN